MKVVLAYSGGLDTSICIKWLMDEYDAEVITLTLNLGQDETDLKKIEEKAKKLGAVKTISLDARAEFIKQYINPSIKANGLYQKTYPLSTALGRPLIAKHLVEVANKQGAECISHGSTGKGNDQVRFELAVRALNPDLNIIAPAREWDLTRDSAIDYAKKHNISVSVGKKNPYSIDVNLWGRSIEAGPLEELTSRPDENIYEWTTSPVKAPDEPKKIVLGFERGLPISLDGVRLDELDLIKKLNKLGGKHGIGRIDTIEDRLVGIKSREIYECPGAKIILYAHYELEKLTLSREQINFKQMVESKWSQMVYYGLWHEPLKNDLDFFIEHTQDTVSGEIGLILYKGNIINASRKSPHSLYDKGLATYELGDRFNHRLAEGFIRLWGLPSEIAARKRKK